MKILYFTATGNSLYIAKSFGGEQLSIPQMIKEGRYDFTDETIGIVFPLHSWSAPPNVIDFLRKATFNCDYLFAIITYGAYSGAVATQLIDIGNKAGYSYSYINKIKMVDNYLPTFNMSKQIEKEGKKKIEKHLEVIKSDVACSKKWIAKENILDKMAMNWIIKRGNKPFSKKRLKMHAFGEGIENYIYLDGTCTQCGVCSKVCPVDNIEMDKDNGKICLSDKCFACFACIQNCPTKSIHIKGEVSNDRYRNRHIKLDEIIDSNR